MKVAKRVKVEMMLESGDPSGFPARGSVKVTLEAHNGQYRDEFMLNDVGAEEVHEKLVRFFSKLSGEQSRRVRMGERVEVIGKETDEV